MNLKLIQAVLLIALISLSSSAPADDWTTWRGPNRNGIVTDSAWNPTAIKNGAKVAWDIKVGDGHSSFSIKGDKLYTMGNENGTDVVYCLRTKDGSEIWRHSYSCEAGNFKGPRATPVLDGNKLYTFSRDAKVFCLNPETGAVIWKRDLMAEENATDPKWGHASSPVIEDNLLILNACAHGVALDKSTGKTIWASNKGEASYASAVIYALNGKKIAAIFSAPGMNAVDLKTGKRLWHHQWTTAHTVHAADPIISDGHMYLSSGYKTGAGLLDIRGAKPKQVWGVQADMKNHFNSSVLIDGNIYGIAGNTGSGVLTCIDFMTGNIKWSVGKGYEGLISANGKLIIMDKKGVLTIAEVNPTKFVEVAKTQVLDGGAQNWTVPVLVNGYIYCRNSKGRIVCVDSRK